VAYIRVTVTVPEELVRRADALAEELERSRSWVLGRALREYLVGKVGDVKPSPAVGSRPAPAPDDADDEAGSEVLEIPR
jgi:hypothetical protein